MTRMLESIKETRPLSFTLGKRRASREEFEKVALPHHDRLYTAAFYLTRNEADAEELVQEAYLRAFRFFHQFEPGTNCRAWLLSILRNVFINRYRQSKQQPGMVNWETIDETYAAMVAEHEMQDKTNPETVLYSRAMDSEVQQALKELPEDFRTAIILVDIEELSYDEAAEIMECPVGTVRSRLSRGRRLLQVRLKEYAEKQGLLRK